MRSRYFLMVGFAFAALLYAVTGVYQVSPGERAVVRRFGRVLRDDPGPGLHVGLPWGIDRVDRVAVDRVQRVAVGFTEESARDAAPAGQLLTGDHNLVDVQATLYYRVRPDEAARYVAHADRIDGLVARTAEAVLAQWVASRTVDETLLNGKVQLRSVLSSQVQSRIEEYSLGVEVIDASVNLAAPPDEVKPAFDAVAREQTGIATKVNGAEQQAETDWRVALSQKYRVEQETAAYAQEQRSLAESRAESFRIRLRKYREGLRDDPLYLRQIWDEERGKLFGRLKANRGLGLLDDHLGPDGLDITTMPPWPGKP
jgi:membrane protease subunit HflK